MPEIEDTQAVHRADKGGFRLPEPQRTTWNELQGLPPDPVQTPDWVKLPSRQAYQGQLWHYTDTSGALGILTSGTLRATALPFLNDTREYSHGLDVLREVMEAIRASRNIHPAQKNALTLVSEAVENPDLMAEIYVACASEDGDSLSQWRAYGGGDSVSLGFETRSAMPVLVGPEDHPAIKPSEGKHPETIHWKRVAYGRKDSFDYISEVLGYLGHTCPKPPVKREEMKKFVHGGAARTLLEALALCKDTAFSDEREVRAIARRPVDLTPSFRAGKFGLTPYLDMTFAPGPEPFRALEPPRMMQKSSNFPLNSVRVGPRQDAGTAVLGIQIFLQSSSAYSHVSVSQSLAPYR